MRYIQTKPDGRICQICGDTDHQAMECHHRDEVTLPTGKTCGDCVFFTGTCSWLIKAEAADKVCDWAPSRFVERAPFVVTNDD